jgi:outer membrane lipoprotein-sorting protein
MKTMIRLPLAAALLMLPSLAGAMTADELVAKNLAARGGAEKLKTVQSVRWTGKARFGTGIYAVEADYAAVARQPGRVRASYNIQGFDNVYAYDGRDAWKVEPGGGRKDAERLSADEAKNLVEVADFQGWLVDYKAKGHKVAYLGTEDIDGTLAHKLKLTRANGDFHYLFIDPDHFLEIRIETHRWVRGVEQIFEADLGEYEEVGGTFWPYLMVEGPKGVPDRTTTIVEKVELNVPVDDALFRIPETAKKK